MSLLPSPTTTVTIGQTIEITPMAQQPSRTYAIDFSAKTIKGHVDKAAAIKQAIIKILATERFAHLIYSWNYGIEMSAVTGKSYPVFASEIKRVIKEALLADSRITAIVDMAVEQIDKRTAKVAFTAQTIFGEIPIERTVRMVNV